MSPNVELVEGLKVVVPMWLFSLTCQYRTGMLKPTRSLSPHHQARADVREALDLEDGGALGAVAVVDNQRLVRELGDVSDRVPPVTTQIQRIEHKPIAAALGRIEAIQVEPLCFLGKGIR